MSLEDSAENLALSVDAPWKWARPANDKVKAFSEGFVEELDVVGRWWTWSKGQNALTGDLAESAFSLSIDPDGQNQIFSGAWSSDNKPRWEGGLPKGFRFKVSATTGIFSGRAPAEAGGKLIAHFGILTSPDDLDLGTGRPVSGGGFGVLDNSTVPTEIRK